MAMMLAYSFIVDAHMKGGRSGRHRMVAACRGLEPREKFIDLYPLHALEEVRRCELSSLRSAVHVHATTLRPIYFYPRALRPADRVARPSHR